MKLEIYSRQGIRKRAEQPFLPGTALISIGDPEAPAPVLRHRPDHVLRLVFDDVSADLVMEVFGLPEEMKEDEARLADCLLGYDTVLFTDAMADRAAEFILAHVENAPVFLCQCEFGQSRSAACAAAIAQHVHQDGARYFSDARYGSNRTVYRKLLAALERRAGQNR